MLNIGWSYFINCKNRIREYQDSVTYGDPSVWNYQVCVNASNAYVMLKDGMWLPRLWLDRDGQHCVIDGHTSVGQ